MNPWITAALAVFALGCLGGLVWLVRCRTPDSLPRPGSDGQWSGFPQVRTPERPVINDQEQSDRAEGEGRDG